MPVDQTSENGSLASLVLLHFHWVTCNFGLVRTFPHIFVQLCENVKTSPKTPVTMDEASEDSLDLPESFIENFSF